MKNRKIMISIFACFLVVGIVFAATSGLLNIDGAINFADNNDLIFVEDSVHTTAETASSTEIRNEGQSLRMVANLDTVGDVVTFTFKVHNIGNAVAVFASTFDTIALNYENASMNQDDLRFGGTYLNLQGLSVQPGETTNEYTFVVEWFKNLTASGYVIFEFDLPYAAEVII